MRAISRKAEMRNRDRVIADKVRSTLIPRTVYKVLVIRPAGRASGYLNSILAELSAVKCRGGRDHPSYYVVITSMIAGLPLRLASRPRFSAS
jgi:hypothetical protein